MSLRQLENLLGKGLKAEEPNDTEIESLIRSGERRLNDAMNADLAIESRSGIRSPPGTLEPGVKEN